MKQGFLTARRQSLGIAISGTRLYVALPSTDGTVRSREWPLSPLGRTDAEWPALADALTELQTVVPHTSRSLAVALLPPLVHLRRVDLPKLRARELRSLLSRSAARYLPGMREPQTANGVALAQSSPTPYIMAAAATRLIDAIIRAVQGSGWTLTTIVPAHAAWTIAAQHEWPALNSQSGDVVVSIADHVEVLHLQNGRLTEVRHLRREAYSTERTAYTLDQPADTAATYAPDTPGPELLPEHVYVQRALTQRRMGTRVAIALAAATLLAAAGVLAHARYVLHQIVLQRATLAGQAAQASTAQGNIMALTTPLSALERIETKTVLWSQVIADLSEVLPPDASLLSLHGHGDSLAVAGTATHGASVFERVDGAKLIDDVQASAPIRRESKQDSASVDHFEFVARIPKTVPVYATKQPRGKHS
jgi:hypothetical protein